MEPVIHVENLSKHFSQIKAVDDISFQVYKGEVFGILGPNGAGKTTAFECIEGLQTPTSGRTLVLGIDTHREADRAKEHIGVQLQASAYFDQLTLTEILDLFGRIYARRVPSADLLAKVDLSEKAATTVGKLSGGQKQRFTIAAALINDPEIVFLDEPTTGLDPQARRNMWETIRQLHQEGRTVILTTHYMEEAQELCQRVAIMDQGKIVALDAPADLIRRLPVPYLVKTVVNPAVDDAALEKLAAVVRVQAGSDHLVTLASTDAGATVSALLKTVSERNGHVDHLEVETATLEDVFLALTGKELRE
jgi:ABC-2 type transport system ATP-binding protein